MNPARFLKNFLLIFGFFGLAGFSFDSFASSNYYRCSYSGQVRFVYASSAGAACGVVFGAPYFRFGAGDGAWCYSDAEKTNLVGSCNFVSVSDNPVTPADPDSPYCLENPLAPECSGSDPDPGPLEPDDPYCLDDPLNPLCSPEEPSPMECENGVGSEACCASYAYKACEPKSVTWWSPGYGLGGYVTSCSYSCGDSYTPPDPDIPDPTAPSPVNPVNPSNPATPSDPSDPVSVDLSGVNERLDILANLNADGFNALNDSIYKLDRNNQVGLENVRRSVNSGFGDLASRLNPSGAPTFDPNAFSGLDVFTDADSDEMKALLGITGDESYSDLERTINLDDYADDYTFTLPDATCPAPRQLGLSFGTFELNYEPVCEIFDFLGTLVVLTALFLTPIIIFRGL